MTRLGTELKYYVSTSSAYALSTRLYQLSHSASTSRGDVPDPAMVRWYGRKLQRTRPQKLVRITPKTLRPSKRWNGRSRKETLISSEQFSTADQACFSEYTQSACSPI